MFLLLVVCLLGCLSMRPPHGVRSADIPVQAIDELIRRILCIPMTSYIPYSR